VSKAENKYKKTIIKKYISVTIRLHQQKYI